MPSARPLVCMLYGFCEGPQVGKRFERELARAGFQVTHDPMNANIIIGHSGGCFLVPARSRAKIIIQIGLPFWPNRSLPGSIWRKFISDLHSHHREGALHFWLRKTFWNVTYFWNIPANIRMLRGRRRGTLWRQGERTVVIRPSMDTFCTSDVTALPFTSAPKIVELPGHHDQCWRDPAPYIAIIKTYGT